MGKKNNNKNSKYKKFKKNNFFHNNKNFNNSNNKQKYGNKNKLQEKKLEKKKEIIRIEQKIENNLEDTKFRILNEKLYKSSSEEAFNYFKANEEDFIIYHKGFSSQSQKWPANPNNLILKSLSLEKYKSKFIADIGCGEAKIAQKLVPLGYKIYSYDLVSMNKYVTVADMKNLPLKNKFCDIGIFCLSLMNKNFIPFVVESNRILKINGKLLVAEITSRIIDMNKFLGIFEKYGFEVIKRKNIYNYFEMITFKKIKDCQITKEDKELEDTYDILKPCLYKKR
jgi:ribosomal RNA-processing protein 8